MVYLDHKFDFKQEPFDLSTTSFFLCGQSAGIETSGTTRNKERGGGEDQGQNESGAKEAAGMKFANILE